MQTTHKIVSIFLIVLGLLGQQTSGATEQCSEAFPTPNPLAVTEQWRPTAGNLFSAVRANASHNWAYFREIEPHLTTLKKAFSIQGVAIGDFHILNIGDIELSNGTRKIGLIDVDDGGHASLFADFTRAAISNQVSPYKIPLKDFWNAYLSGLKGEKIDKPKLIVDVLGYSHKDYLKRNDDYVSSLIDGKKFSAKAGVLSIESTDSFTQNMYNQSLPAFKQALGKSEILAVGARLKSTGGSQGVPRYWFLIRNKAGDKKVIEFKALAAPAMSMYRIQPPQAERITALIETYRPQKTTYGMYQFLDAGKYKFIARERLKGFLEFDPEGAVTAKDAERGREVYQYLANRAGTWHAQQGYGDELYKALTVNEEAAFAEFQKIISDYISLMQKENAGAN